jgi:hypothetical protein
MNAIHHIDADNQNMIFHDSNQQLKSLVVRAIDFSNVFGSVPHDLIMSVRRQRNFPEWMRNIVTDMYDGATSIVPLKGTRSEALGWKKGVKQGCPLSPLLFNLCIEPLIQAIKNQNRGRGAFIQSGEEQIQFSVQADADNIVVIS